MLYLVRQNPNPYSCNKIVSCNINHTFFLTNAFSLSFCFIMPKSQNHKQISSQTISANRACPLTVVMCQSKTNQNKTNNIHTNKLKLSRPQTIVCFVIMLLLLIPTKKHHSPRGCRPIGTNFSATQTNNQSINRTTSKSNQMLHPLLLNNTDSTNGDYSLK